MCSANRFVTVFYVSLDDAITTRTHENCHRARWSWYWEKRHWIIEIKFWSRVLFLSLGRITVCIGNCRRRQLRSHSSPCRVHFCKNRTGWRGKWSSSTIQLLIFRRRYFNRWQQASTWNTRWWFGCWSSEYKKLTSFHMLIQIQIEFTLSFLLGEYFVLFSSMITRLPRISNSDLFLYQFRMPKEQIWKFYLDHMLLLQRQFIVTSSILYPSQLPLNS